jgi:hypothetical protein
MATGYYGTLVYDEALEASRQSPGMTRKGFSFCTHIELPSYDWIESDAPCIFTDTALSGMSDENPIKR